MTHSCKIFLVTSSVTKTITEDVEGFQSSLREVRLKLSELGLSSTLKGEPARTGNAPSF